MAEKVQGRKVTGPTRPLADVNVVPQGDGQNKIVVCIMPDPEQLSGEGESRGAIALDASLSIKPWFGTPGPFVAEPNRVEPVARKLGEIVCSVTKHDDTHLFYWALDSGEETEDIGTFKSSEIGEAEVSGPKEHKWGKGTHMLPAIKNIVEGIGAGAMWVMGIIVTDGIIEDEEACMAYCMSLGQWLKDNPDVTIKLILIGVGDQVDGDQLERFDDMFEGTDLEDDIDIWSHGLVSNIRNEEDIVAVLFGELMDEETMVAPSGKVLDPGGSTVIQFADGLPGKFSFMLPEGCSSFTLQAGGKEVVQDLTATLVALGQTPG